MEELLHDDVRWLAGPAAPAGSPIEISGGVTSEAEEAQLEALNAWMESVGLPPGALAYDFTDVESGEQRAVFDLAWPHGVQEELSQPVAVLLNEELATITVASQAGFRCFTDIAAFRKYVETEILAEATSI